MEKHGRDRLYKDVVRMVEDEISSGRFPVGSKLPAERELAQRYDISRPTVREAIIALEVRGVVDVRVGSGAYVLAQPDRDAPRAFDVSAIELTEARLLVEGETAALAATSITDDELDDLDRLARRIDSRDDDADPMDQDESERIDADFHHAIAVASRNAALVDSVDRLWDMRRTSAEAVLLHEKARTVDRAPVIREHARIVDALRTRDPDAARKAMRSHLSQVLETLLFATEERAIAEAKRAAQARREIYSRLTA